MVKVEDIKTKIKDKGVKHIWLMKKLGISKRTFYIRLNNSEFKQSEYKMLVDLGIV